MTWPTCLQCGLPYIPVPTIHGCPWCATTTSRPRRHSQDELRTCPTCEGPMRRHAKHCWDCYLAERRRNPIHA